jgi:hypothetical protein
MDKPKQGETRDEYLTRVARAVWEAFWETGYTRPYIKNQFGITETEFETIRFSKWKPR